MKNWKKGLGLVLSGTMLLSCLTACGSSKEKSLLDPENPTTVTVWNYYNGDQLTAFESLVNEFNDTVGAEKGIVAVSVSQGSIDNLATSLLDSVDGKAGAQDIPSLASVYAETAYILNNQQSIVSLDDYFTEDELKEYIPSFLEEGRLTENGDMMIFPVSKSTEVFITNTTDWAEFEAATGITPDSIDSCETLTAAAEAYYNWTDGLTPDVAEDGKALYGRDSVSNYIFIGTKQLGHEMFTVDEEGKVTVDMDRDTFKTLWDNYYIPMINGYFGEYASYRSEDIKTGAILATTSSSSGMSYIPTEVTTADDTTHSIDVSVKKSLVFQDAVDPVSVEQGAGYCVMKTSDAEQYAACEFLKWFTDTDQNLDFSVASGYSPVKIASNDEEKIKSAVTADSPKAQNMLNALLVSSEVYTADDVYTSKAFAGSKEVRDILKNALEETALTDRAAVAEQIAAGTSRADAVAAYSTEEYFDAWFDKLCEQVNAAVS